MSNFIEQEAGHSDDDLSNASWEHPISKKPRVDDRPESEGVEQEGVEQECVEQEDAQPADVEQTAEAAEEGEIKSSEEDDEDSEEEEEEEGVMLRYL